ncbi:MAG: DNA polymerase III subunit delta [Gammaproteobacteria bacterium]
MKLRPEQLDANLSSGKLSPIYLITGDEPLQMMEASDKIRNAAKQQGYDERTILEVSKNFDWNSLFQEADTLSLFASQRLIELRLGSSKPGIKGGKAFVEYAEKLPQDTLLLITADKIEAQSQKAKWFKALENTGTVVQIWPVDAKALPQWIVKRFSDRGRQITRDAATYIADNVEGNMLAASQEIEIILLLADKTKLELDDVMTVGDSSRYDVFKLTDAILEGQSDRAIRILDGLRNEGLEPIIVHWALSRELHSLYKMAKDIATGDRIENVMQKHRVWSNRTNLIRNALQRHKPRGLQMLIKSAAKLEQTLKGASQIKNADAWTETTWLCMRMSGVRLDQGLLKAL